MLDDLNEFIQSNPDPRELKRVVAVQMFLQDYKHREIQAILGVSSGFISKWTRVYEQFGVSGLRLGYQGSVGYLEPEQRQAVITWLQTKNYWNLAELQGRIQDEYDVVFDSKQSYYTLFEQAGISWKKTAVAVTLKKTPHWFKKKQEITDWLEAHRGKIASGKLVVFFQDECHLVWGDLCGYVWAAAFGGKLPTESGGGNNSSRHLSSRNVPWQNQRTHRSAHRQSANQANLLWRG